MAKHKILSVPVVDVDAPKDASWMERYIGIIEFAGIAVWILHQVCKPAFVIEIYYCILQVEIWHRCMNYTCPVFPPKCILLFLE